MRWWLAVWAAVLAVGPVGAATFVVSVGVETYQDETIAPLRYAVADAVAVAGAFREAGVPDGNIALLTSAATDATKTATVTNLLQAMKSARARARVGDTVIFLFSGHGMEKDGNSYLLTQECLRDFLDRTALPTELLNEAWAGLQASNLLMVIDACRNDPDAGKATADAQLDESFAKGMRPSRLPTGAGGQAPNVALWLACDVGKRAWEFPEEGHGAFTYYLLKGLREEAPRTAEGVPLDALADYLRREVAAWATRNQREQEPRLEQVSGHEFLLPAPRPADPNANPAPPTTPASRPNERPANWPSYLSNFQLPAGIDWSSFRVSEVDGMPQVLVPAGEFLMGSPADEPGRLDDEGPQQRVELSAYWMDLHEVTSRQFCQFLNARRPTEALLKTWGKPKLSAIREQGGRYVPAAGKEDYPIIWVTWHGASAYAAWAGRALPTEAQWERAARGGQQTKYVWGDRDTPPEGAGNFGDETLAQQDRTRRETGLYLVGYRDGYSETSPVCSFRANAFGLYDLEGNVNEWCQDLYGADWYGQMPLQDPVNLTPGTGDNPARVARGGSWVSSPRNLRVSFRLRNAPGTQISFLGFRCAAPAR